MLFISNHLKFTVMTVAHQKVQDNGLILFREFKRVGILKLDLIYVVFVW